MSDVTVRAPFPDVEATLVAALADLASCGTVTPPNLQQAMPFLRITKLGGSDDGFSDTSSTSIDAFASTRAVALVLAEDVRARLLSYPLVVNGVTIDRVTTVTGPYEVPWASDLTVRRFSASYTIVTRR